MKMWIAKNEKQSYLLLFEKKPVKRYDKFLRRWCWKSEDMCSNHITLLNGYEFPEVTFENSPMEVELKLIEK